jgi:hypothetical protein
MMPDMAAIPVNAGFGWTAAGAWGTFLGVIALIIRQVGPWKRQTTEADERLRKDLLERVEKLERTLDRERKRHEAERSLDRHKLNNIVQCFDAVMLMLEAAPERAPEIVVRIKAMRASQMQAEAAEKAVIHAAEIAADAKEEGHA